MSLLVEDDLASNWTDERISVNDQKVVTECDSYTSMNLSPSSVLVF